MNKARVWLVALAGVIALAGLTAWSFNERTRARTRDEAPSVPLQPAVTVRPITEEDRKELWSLVRSIREKEAPQLTREELLTLLRQAALAREAGDIEAFNIILGKLRGYGSAIQKLLAQILLDKVDLEVRKLAALTLLAVGTEEIGPFALTLLKVESSEEIRAIAIQLLTKFRYAGAEAWLTHLLFTDTESVRLRALVLQFFAQTGGEEVLVRALREIGELRKAASEALVTLGTETAGRALFSLWTEEFRAKEAMGQYFLLKSLARFDSKLLGTLMDEGLAALTDPSQRNVLLSMLAHADRDFALDRVRLLLEGDTDGNLRQQAIHVAAAIGGREGQRILLDIFSDPASKKELLAAVNGILRQKSLAVDFSEVLSLHASQKDPVLRSVLAVMLARDADRLKSDPSLAASLLNEAEKNMRSKDRTLRGVSIDLAARLAKHDPDPAAKLSGIYGDLSPRERDAHPSVLEALGSHADRPEARKVLVSSLFDGKAANPRRAVAGDALFASGNEQPVYDAISKSKNTNLTTMLSGVVLARGGASGADRLRKIASQSSGRKKQILQEQLKAWRHAKQ